MWRVSDLRKLSQSSRSSETTYLGTLGTPVANTSVSCLQLSSYLHRSSYIELSMPYQILPLAFSTSRNSSLHISSYRKYTQSSYTFSKMSIRPIITFKAGICEVDVSRIGPASADARPPPRSSLY